MGCSTGYTLRIRSSALIPDSVRRSGSRCQYRHHERTVLGRGEETSCRHGPDETGMPGNEPLAAKNREYELRPTTTAGHDHASSRRRRSRNRGHARVGAPVV